jgi:hypothetical protein
MAKDYRIRFSIDDTPAQAATKRSIAGIQAIEQAANKAAQAVQRAHAGGGTGGGAGGAASSPQARAAVDLDAIQDRLILKDYNRRVQHEVRKINVAERAASQAAAAEALKSSQLEAIQDRYIKRDYDRRGQFEQQKVNAQAREASRLEAIQDRYIQKDYKQRVAFEKQKIADAEQAAEKQERIAAQSADRREQIFLRSAAVVIPIAMAGMQALNEGYAKIRENALAAAEATLTMEKNLRVEGALKGDTTPEKTLAESIQFRAATGLGTREATEFTKQYAGTLPIAFEKGNITPQVAEELRMAAGTRAARLGGEAGTHGELAGILGQFGKVGSREEGLSQLEAIRVGLVKGRGDDSPLSRQMLNVAGSLAGEGHAIPSLPEMAALIGVTSLSGGPRQAADRANQLYRGLKIGLTKQTKVRGTDQAQGAYLKGLNVGEKDTLEQTLDKIVPDLQRARESGRDLDAYLAGKNFRAGEERRAIIETFENYGPLKQRMQEAREAGLPDAERKTLGDKEIEKNKAYLEDTTGRTAVSDALADAAKVTLGAKNKRLLAVLKETESSPEFQAGDQSIYTALGGDTLRGLMTGNIRGPGEAGRGLRLEGTAIERLQKRATAAGVTPEEQRGARIGAYGAGPENYTAEFVNQLEALITKHGGSNAINTAPQLDKMVEVLTQIRDQQGGPPGKTPEALPVAPRGGNARP